MNVTIIVPVHNSEKYLKECIQSALSQSFSNIEILCIDGGSTDASFEIISELQKIDKRIIYIKDPNTSYGHKINIGIERASGGYISILESDDKMCPNMIEDLYNIAEKYEPDIVDADFYEMFCFREKMLYGIVNKYQKKECYNHLINCCDEGERDIVTNGIWTALYKREFIIEHNIRLNESPGASYQDMSFLFLTSFLARNVYHLNVPLYQYRIDNVQSSVNDNKKIFDIVGECEFLRDDLKQRGIWDEELCKLYYIRKYNAFYWNYKRLNSDAREVFLEKYLQELKSDVENGYLNREMVDETVYERTFLLIDNINIFVEMTSRNDNKSSNTKICDVLEEIGDQDVVVFGAGILGKRVLSILLQNKSAVRGVCDNSPDLHGKSRNGFEIISVERAVREFPDALYLIVNRKHGEEMKTQLIKSGIREKAVILIK